MEKIDFEVIFKKYLQRNPYDGEYKIHLHKKLEDFEIELQNCSEYLNIKNSTPLDKKIALLISGHIRNYQLIQSLNKIKNYDFDVFVHTWDNYGVKGKETDINDNTDTNNIINIIETIPNLVSYKIENNKNFLLSLNDESIYFNYSSPEKFIKSQLYSINQSFKLFDEYKQRENINYDLVIKLRFDLIIEDFIVDNELINDVNNYKIIFAPNDGCGHTHPDSDSTSCLVCDKMYYTYNLKYVHSFEHSHIMCDLFAYGSYKSMKVYTSLYEKYDDMNKSFIYENLKKIEETKINYFKEGNVFLLERNQMGHLNSLFYINCSYPERLLQKELKDYMIPRSKKIKVKFLR